MISAPPSLLVEIPPGRRAEREYALAVLLGEWLRTTYTVRIVEDLGETRLSLADGSDVTVVAIPDVLFARSVAWLTPQSLPMAPLTTVPLPDWTGLDDRLPLIYPTAGAGGLVRRDGSRLVLGWDLLGSLLFLLARYEEHVGSEHLDEHGRFPAAASIMAASGWLQWPVADMYLHVFAAVLRLAWPRLGAVPATGETVHLSHDVDHPSSPLRWLGRERPRVLVGDIAHRRDVRLAASRAASFLAGTNDISRHDPFNTYEFLMQASEDAGVRSTFFFLTRDTEVPFGSRYRIDDAWARRLLPAIADRGHDIGLHGSYPSATDPARLAAEWRLLQDACRALPAGRLRAAVRQHYLRWVPGETWPAQVRAGLQEDETLGFAAAIGYRAGTARSFPAFDLSSGRHLALRVTPLHVMDATIRHYLKRTDEEALAMVAELRDRTRTYGGALSVLWHNSSLETHAARRFYLDLLRELAT